MRASSRPKTLQLHGMAILLLANLSGGVSAAEVGVQTSTEANRWQWLEGQRDQVSRGVTALGRNLDDWLAGEGIGDQPNETYLRVRFHQQVGSLNGYHSTANIGGSLDLPRTSQRWKLIFESDNDELNSLQNDVLGEKRTGAASGGFRYLQDLNENLELSHDIGLRGRLPADPYYRFRARFHHSLGNAWALGINQKIWNYRSDGWGYDTNVMFTRPLASSDVLEISSKAKYQQNHNQVEFAQTVSLHQTLGNLVTLSYTVGALGLSKPNPRINNYYVETQYRRAIRSDWLFLELVPQILVSRNENWRPEPRMIVNLELLFFDI